MQKGRDRIMLQISSKRERHIQNIVPTTKTTATQYKKKTSRERVKHPQEGREQIAKLLHEEINKCKRLFLKKAAEKQSELQEAVLNGKPKEVARLRREIQDLENQAMEWSPAKFQQMTKTKIMPDNQVYPIPNQTFYQLLAGADQGYNMMTLAKLAVHLTKDENRTITYTYSELLDILSLGASRVRFNLSDENWGVVEEKADTLNDTLNQ